MSEEPTGRVEEFVVSGDTVVSKIKEILHEGKIRRISIQTEKGDKLLEIPLTIGLVAAGVGVVWAPIWAAISAIAAAVIKLKIVVERVE
jgi:hypothetical protein